MYLRLITISILLFFCSTALTAEKVGGLYKWTDDKGHVHYTDTPPPEAADEKREVLNEQGMTVKVLEAEKTPEQLAAAQRARELAAKQAKLAAKQAERDRALLATYVSVSDIERARENRLQVVEAQIQVASGNVGHLEERIMQLEQQAAGYEKGKGSVPPFIAQQLDDARKQLMENQRYLLERRAEQDEIRAAYAKEIARFKELKEK